VNSTELSVATRREAVDAEAALTGYRSELHKHIVSLLTRRRVLSDRVEAVLCYRR